MNKYFLNFLRWITQGELPDNILRKTYNHKIEGDKFNFNFRANINTKDWRYGVGNTK